MVRCGKEFSLCIILYQTERKGKGRSSSKTVKTFKKVTYFSGGIKTGNSLQCCKHQGFTHYPHSYPHRYVNNRKDEFVKKVAKNGFFSKFSEKKRKTHGAFQMNKCSLAENEKMRKLFGYTDKFRLAIGI